MDSATPPPHAPGQSAWQHFSQAAVRAFHRYATWLVSLSWKRFILYALALLIGSGIVSSLPPFSWTYTETTSPGAHRPKAHPAPLPPPLPSASMPAPGPDGPVGPAVPLPPAPGAQPAPPAAPAAAASDASPTIRITKLPDAGGDGTSKSVNITLPGLVIENKAKGEKARPGGVNITIGPEGIHVERADRTVVVTPSGVAASAAVIASQAAAHSRGQAASARVDAARRQAESARLQEDALKIAAAELASAASRPVPASSPARAGAASGEQIVEMDVGDRHIRIAVPPGADNDAVREAIDEARQQIVQQLEEARDQARDAAEQQREAIADAQRAAQEALDEANDDSPRTRVHRVSYGESLPGLAFWWIVVSLIIKLAYKGRLQAETKAAVLAETAEAESLRRQVIEARMAMMQAQVEPHFLFNTLASIDHLIEVDPKRASRMQRNLIALLRASMPTMREANDGGLRPLQREMAVIRPYLDILQVRMEERLTTSVDVPDGLNSAEFPPMMIQTLVENAIKHGLEPKPEGGHLAVKAEIRHGKLVVTVADTGLGFSKAEDGTATTAGTGVGLANVRERLTMLYGSRASLTISDNPGGGTIATITVPYTTRTSDEGASA